MKKVNIKLIIISLILILISLINVKSVYATEVASGSCGTNVTWSLDDSGVLTIQGSGNMIMGDSVRKSAWEDYQNQVKTVNFVGEISSISPFAFRGNENIEEIILPDAVNTIGRYAFWGCTNLKSVTFSKNIISIDSTAFYNCKSLEEVDLPESLRYIRSYAFAECSSLKSITIRSEMHVISTESQAPTIPETTTIVSHKYSNAYYYAKYNGIKFKDLATGKITQEKITKQSFLDVLPTENVKAVGVTSHGARSGVGSSFSGYRPEFCYEKDTSNATYQEIKQTVDGLISGCTTDEQKARNILNWLTENMVYANSGARATIEYMYYIFSTRNSEGKLRGNCESHTMIMNYMLYLADIPVGTASDMTHEWTVAFIDGKWIYIDATGGSAYYGITNGTTEVISFAYNGFIYAVDDPTEGLKITGIAQSQESINNLTEITIPNDSKIKGIYKTAFPTTIDLIATKGPKGNPTVGEKFVRENRECCQVIGNQIIGRQYHENNNADTCTRCKNPDAVGDINGDGKVNTADFGLLNAHLRKKKLLIGEELVRADINGDGKVNTADFGLLNAHLRKKKLLW